MASGKEDIDVRFLEGRPFIVEIINSVKNSIKLIKVIPYECK